MLSKKNSFWWRLITEIAPGSPKLESTSKSAVYTTRSPLTFFFSYQSLITVSPLIFCFLVPKLQKQSPRTVSELLRGDMKQGFINYGQAERKKVSVFEFGTTQNSCLLSREQRAQYEMPTFGEFELSIIGDLQSTLVCKITEYS